MPRPSEMQPSLLAYLRHELCAPVNGMIGYSELLLEALQTQKESSLFQDVQKIQTCSQRLLNLVTTLLDPMQLEKLQIGEELSGFIATRRMELLTSLSAIVGYCEMLLEEAPAELIPDLDSLNASAHQLLTSVNDIVYLAQQQLQTLDVLSTSELSKDLTMASLVESALSTLEDLSLKSSKKQTQSGMILVVDDNPMNCDLLARQLKRQGYGVTISTNAKQALRLLQATPPDLIVLDVVIPGINGIELLQQLKQHDRFQHIPVIMLSALDEIASAIKCIELGAKDYLQKPLDLTLLTARIKAYLKKQHRLSQFALAANPTPQTPQFVDPNVALQRLLEGNQRFMNGMCQHPQRSRLQATASAQYPSASILGCADSRVPSEIVSNQGIGDLFVIRVAGNVASQTAIGSLEFAASVLGTQLIVVVGHSSCGGVAAAVRGELMPGRIGGFVEDIKLAVTLVKDKMGDLEENAVIANIQYQTQKLAENSTILADLIQAGKLKIVGSRYDLQTGQFSIVT